MPNVLQLIATGLTSLAAPLVQWEFQPNSPTPFADDRRALRGDWERVRADLSKSIEKVKKEHDAEAHRR